MSQSTPAKHDGHAVLFVVVELLVVLADASSSTGKPRVLKEVLRFVRFFRF